MMNVKYDTSISALENLKKLLKEKVVDADLYLKLSQGIFSLPQPFAEPGVDANTFCKIELIERQQYAIIRWNRVTESVNIKVPFIKKNLITIDLVKQWLMDNHIHPDEWLITEEEIKRLKAERLLRIVLVGDSYLYAPNVNVNIEIEEEIKVPPTGPIDEDDIKILDGFGEDKEEIIEEDNLIILNGFDEDDNKEPLDDDLIVLNGFDSTE